MSPLEAPKEALEQLDMLTRDLRSILADDLVGVYVHGSLVLGCFSPERSDIDVIAVTRRATTNEARGRLGELMLRSSADRGRPRKPPYPLELSLLTEQQLRPWRYPTPFDFHYGESQRERFMAGYFSPLWTEDYDLAAHVTVLREAGVALFGAPIQRVFPPVPERDYVDSLLRDFDWSRDRRLGLYGALNASRIWATLAERRLHSKLSGGLWALQHASARFHGLVERSVAVYRGGSVEAEFDPAEVAAYMDYVAPIIRSLAGR